VPTYLPSQKKESKEGNDMVRSADYIKSNFKDLSLSVETLAEIQGISEVYFRRLFKKQYGISPSQYIITTRIEHAKSLIKHSFLSLEECAVQSGFSSVQYFCRVFKKVTGMTPTEYRKAK
jgi:two-component system response regulator YesN